ncbi:hypothetical protein SEETMRM10961_16795 [Salmonella enterica subsp. enterica serovar Typhimurium]|nr:hypothetical protein SEETMRM10961_16795 [Salmonella enterica subsp. enterica serovar Typhimurium]
MRNTKRYVLRYF